MNARRAATALLASGLLALAAPVSAACRQALILGLDVSGSVDAEEYRLQLDGMATALRDPAVQSAILQFPEAPVRLKVFEWSGGGHQRVVIGWTTLTRPDQLEAMARLLATTRPVPVSESSTAIVAAMRFAKRSLLEQDCWQRTFDIAGDGPANIGAHPGYLVEEEFAGITVNALVIGPESRSNTTKDLSNVESLLEYFRNHVIRGPGAFAEVADDYTDFAAAMARKLIREVGAPALSRRDGGHRFQ